MIYHNGKNGFPSAVVNELYKPDTLRIYSTEDHKVRNQRIAPDVFVTHDLFESKLSIRLYDEIYVINLNKIIYDILEVENENQNLFSDH